MLKASSTLPSIVVALGVLSGVVGRPVLYVERNATGPTHDGLSWRAAYRHLRNGLDADLRIKQSFDFGPEYASQVLRLMGHEAAQEVE